MTQKKKNKLSETADRGKDLNKLMTEKANREENPNTEPVQESILQDLDKAEFLTTAFKTMYQGNQNNQGNNNNMAMELVKILLPLVMNQNPQQKTESTNSTLIKTFGSMFDSLNQQSRDYLGLLINEMRRGGGQPQQNPEEKLMKNFEFFRNITGDQRQKSEGEMKYGLEREKLVLQENARQDMLNREERAVIRDDKKSERILNIGGVVLDKIVGNGLGNLVQDVMSAKTTTPKRRGRKEPQQNEGFDPSLLDDL